MQWLAEYGLFLAKFVTIAIILFIFIGGIVASSAKGKSGSDESLEVKPLNKRYKDMAMALNEEILDKKSFKALLKIEKKEEKEKDKGKSKKEQKDKNTGDASLEHSLDNDHDEVNEDITNKTLENSEDKEEKRVFVLNFDGDIKASEVDFLREEITAILSVAKTTDEVVVRLESPGGMVHSYGLAASQLARFRERNIPLTVCVDKVAASGGYMMACVANKIICAPFAVIGSIGVVAQIPNFNKVLKKNDVEFEQFTAGEYKRTVTMFGETSVQDREKMQEEINEIHGLFKEFINDYRPNLDINTVSTGETWYGKKALEMHLVDAIQTSDDYLLGLSESAELFQITYEVKKSLKDRIPFLMASMMKKFFSAKDELNSGNKFDYYR